MQNSELGPWFSVSHSFTQHTVHLLGRSEEDWQKEMGEQVDDLNTVVFIARHTMHEQTEYFDHH